MDSRQTWNYENGRVEKVGLVTCKKSIQMATNDCPRAELQFFDNICHITPKSTNNYW